MFETYLQFLCIEFALAVFTSLLIHAYMYILSYFSEENNLLWKRPILVSRKKTNHCRASWRHHPRTLTNIKSAINWTAHDCASSDNRDVGDYMRPSSDGCGNASLNRWIFHVSSRAIISPSHIFCCVTLHLQRIRLAQTVRIYEYSVCISRGCRHTGSILTQSSFQCC